MSRDKVQEALSLNGIRHFTASELTTARRWERRQDVPDEMVANIIQAAKIIDGIRDAWGAPVVVVSAYRSLAYNRLVGSADTSQHVKYRAVDIRPSSGSLKEFQGLCASHVEAWRKKGVIVGFGLYNTFAHIDAGGRQKNTNWDYRGRNE